MTKEEMKNKYSAFITEISEILGLGKPVDILKLCATTDLFFRPLEKHIEELKEENKVLAQNLEDTEILNKTYEKRFSDLEKENAELKKLKRECETSLCRAEYQYNYEQLTKAKEIIKGLLPMASNFVFGTLPKLDEEVQLYRQAEQFLSEVEK